MEKKERKETAERKSGRETEERKRKLRKVNFTNHVTITTSLKRGDGEKGIKV